MMEGFIRRPLIGFMAAILVTAISAYQCYAAESRKAKKEVKVIWDTKPFDVHRDALPLYYMGHNPKFVYEKTKPLAKQLQKDEFETFEAYEKRLPVVRQTVGLWSASERPNPGGGGILDRSKAIWYDAYDGTLSITVSTLRYSSYTVAREQSNRDIRSYIGQTIGGAKARVRVVESRSWEVEVRRPPACTKPNTSDLETRYELKVPPERAREIKNDIRVLYLFSPVDVKHEEGYTNPRWPEAVEGPNYNYTVTGELEEVWIYNFSTGEVYMRDKWREETR